MSTPTKMALLKKAADELIEHALVYACGDISDQDAIRKHLQLADEYARAKWAAKTGSGGRSDSKPSTSNEVLRFGMSRGKTIGEAKSGDLKWCMEQLEHDVRSPEKQRWRQDNQKTLAAIRAELNNRGEL